MAPCPWCGRPSALWAQASDLNRGTVEQRFDYYRCGHCGVLFLEPVPNDLSRFYPDDYHQFPTARAGYAEISGVERFKLDLVEQQQAAGRLLDIGPGGGAFAYLAQEAGFDVEILELSAEACSALRSVLGIQAHQGLAEPGSLSDLGPYDVITLWHSIEHVSDPRATLDVAASELAPGGILVVAAPNPASLQLRLLGRRWPHLDAPRHLRLIPAPTLVDWALTAGLEIEQVTYTDPGSLEWNRFGWSEWLANLLPMGPSRDARWRRGLRRALRRAGSWIERLVRPIERRHGRGATYTVIVRQPRTSLDRTARGGLT